MDQTKAWDGQFSVIFHLPARAWDWDPTWGGHDMVLHIALSALFHIFPFALTLLGWDLHILGHLFPHILIAQIPMSNRHFSHLHTY